MRSVTAGAGATQGVLTIAYGSSRYVRMAELLARSLQRHAPAVPRAIVTDSQDPRLPEVFDRIIPFEPEYGRGHVQKLSLDRYTPFDSTLYIDVDSLVVSSLDDIWPLFSAVPVGVVGSPMREGNWFGDIGGICASLGVSAIPRFNGGFVFLRRTPAATAVFETARELMGRYAELGFLPMRNGAPNDEPVLGCALALHGIAGVLDGGISSRTPMGIRGPLRLDVLRGGASFDKEGVRVRPAIVHFCGWRSRGFHYRRESVKLSLAARWNVPPAALSRAVDIVANPPYTLAAAVCRPALRTFEWWRAQRKAAA